MGAQNHLGERRARGGAFRRPRPCAGNASNARHCWMGLSRKLGIAEVDAVGVGGGSAGKATYWCVPFPGRFWPSGILVGSDAWAPEGEGRWARGETSTNAGVRRVRPSGGRARRSPWPWAATGPPAGQGPGTRYPHSRRGQMVSVSFLEGRLRRAGGRLLRAGEGGGGPGGQVGVSAAAARLWQVGKGLWPGPGGDGSAAAAGPGGAAPGRRVRARRGWARSRE